jgi:uncharacterized protein (TIGR03435 family)
LVVLAAILNVSSYAENLEFEVASVKQNKSGNGVKGGCRGIDGQHGSNDVVAAVPLGRCQINAALLTHLIVIAYQFQIQNLKGGPDWVRNAPRFDIDAKAENPSTATEQQLLSMLQNLLADRFHLKLRRETQSVAGHTLVIAKNGPKLKEATGDRKGFLRIAGAAIFKPDAIERRNLDQNSMIAEKTSMSELAVALTNLPGGGPVVDRTGLTGSYDLQLRWEPGESMSAVLQEQLGLKLEPAMLPVDILMIDSAEIPAEN